jgi:hypothetical protein
MVYPIFGAITASFFLAIIRDKDTFSSYPARIEALFIVFLVFIFISAKAVDRFSAVFSAFAKSFF